MRANAPERASHSNGGPRIELVAAAVAAVFVLIGILGFIPGVTTHYGDLGPAGLGSRAELFGVFQVSILHNALHLAFGLVGLVLARTVAGSRIFLAGGGAVYLVLWIYGFAIGHDGKANVIPLNTGDNFLHLGLGLGMVILGLLLAPHAFADGTPPDEPNP